MTTFWMSLEGGALVPPFIFAQTTQTVKQIDKYDWWWVIGWVVVVGLIVLFFDIYMDLSILRSRMRRNETHVAGISDSLREERINRALVGELPNLERLPRNNQKSRRKNIVAAMEPPKKPSMVFQRKSRENLVADTDVQNADTDNLFE